MKAEIITIGDEILIGQIVDTNSAWLGEKLNAEGISIRQITSISDKHDHIISALKRAGELASLVLVTGGLGPTRDDKTKAAICQFFDTELVMDESVLTHVAQLLEPRGIEMNELNQEQALVPKAATVLPNSMGTAPGLWLEKEGSVYVFLPGVPFEMKTLIAEQVLPRVCEKFHTQQIIHRTVLSQGLPESILAKKLENWESGLPEFINLAYLPSPLHIRLRLSARGRDREMMDQVIEVKIQELMKLIPENIFGFEDDTLAGSVGKLLLEQGCSVSTAESCTGGNIAHFFTSNEGSSAYFKGSVVAYSNQSKTRALGVDEMLIERDGAVSKSVVEAMASGACQLFATEYAVATSGIAGPGGGTEEKPVGTVWIAIASPRGVFSKRFQFGTDRGRNIIRSTQSALNFLRSVLKKEELKTE